MGSLGHEQKCGGLITGVKKHGGYPTEVSDMARNMKMELLTFFLNAYTVSVEKLWTQNTRNIHDV
jgi:hypothetical protein